MRPFRFGLQVRSAADEAAWRAQIVNAERLGYDVVTMPDHFNDHFAPSPALAWAAAVTRRIRIGSLVFCNDFRHPAVLAKELATLDVLSGGRLEIGLGAGWANGDYQPAGIPRDSAGVRVARFEEALRVIRSLLSSDEPVSFRGRFYTLDGLRGMPRPLQTPHPPLYIGGGGERMLAIAAREADVVGLHANLERGVFDGETFKTLGHDALQRKIDTVRQAAGTRFDQVELALVALVVAVTDHREHVASRIAAEYEVPVEVLLGMPNTLVGTVDQIARQLHEQRERHGITYYTVSHEHAEPFAEVIRQVRR